MIFERLTIPDVILVTPKKIGDHRGFFSETYHYERYREGGISCRFVQDNHSHSAAKGTLRGFHFQAAPKAQDKLVRCTRGRLLDVALDIRKGSPTFGQTVSAELSAENGKQLFLPVGFAHAFVTLEADTEAQYKVSNYYDQACDLGIAHDDPAIGFDWPVEGSGLVLSERDKSLPLLNAATGLFSYEPA